MSEILIIGAGAAGLMAARELLRKGKAVTLIEARDRAGGRIHTVNENGFQMPVEYGAEFIHGKLPITFKLLKQAGLKPVAVEGEMIREKDDALEQEKNFIEGWSLLTKRLKKLGQDMALEDFLLKYFPEKNYSALRKTVQRFAEGFDAADIKKASAFALRDEWSGTDNEQQYRISGGYGAMIDFLLEEIKAFGADMRLSSIVKEIRWKKGEVTVVIDNGPQIHGNQVIVTVPLGILQLNEHSKGAITFSPSLPEHQKAIQALGYGGVIKILLRFNERFWGKREMKNHK